MKYSIEGKNILSTEENILPEGQFVAVWKHPHYNNLHS